MDDMPYEGDECPTCKAEREAARRLIEYRLRQHREEKDRLIRDVEEAGPDSWRKELVTREWKR